MTTTQDVTTRLEQLRTAVSDAVQLADQLSLPEVAVRLEQARLLLVKIAG